MLPPMAAMRWAASAEGEIGSLLLGLHDAEGKLQGGRGTGGDIPSHISQTLDGFGDIR